MPSNGLHAAALSTLLLGLAIVAPAQAQQITLRVADTFPNGHTIHENATKLFMTEVTRLTNGQVTFQHFPAEQIGKAKDLLALTQAGVTDIGLVVPAYTSDKMPLSAVADLPGAFTSNCQGTLAMETLLAPGGVLRTREWDVLQLHPLFSYILAPYQMVVSSSKPVKALADVEGLKIRSVGGPLDLAVHSVKAVPVRMSPAEIYESMSRGTIDGALLAMQSVVSYDLTKLIRAGTIDENFGTIFSTYAMSERNWRKLPTNVQAAITTAGSTITHESCKRFEASEQTAMKAAQAAGMTAITFNDGDRAKLHGALLNIRRDWAKDLDRRGKPGTEVLDAFAAALGN
ncbi:TRAP transporter substrate-binding protein DctP [Azospirillum sp. YIM B02556]|uniref:TRAP transporter substrate-binding protein DctP n=1 Tax=Azospirillum endophyticum TaxID=2800326 RepID=A0ABS1EZM8_9PROT|nr:TRAP transporter substrate-binding protein DctP [Azospirillum endophyticum]MBK1836552.1 TRAP transporter substrate-binding protein DctP [Azospirillum endophyticum]